MCRSDGVVLASCVCVGATQASVFSDRPSISLWVHTFPGIGISKTFSRVFNNICFHETRIYKKINHNKVSLPQTLKHNIRHIVIHIYIHINIEEMFSYLAPRFWLILVGYKENLNFVYRICWVLP